jgi:hypothetical protein
MWGGYDDFFVCVWRAVIVFGMRCAFSPVSSCHTNQSEKSKDAASLGRDEQTESNSETNNETPGG